MTGTRVGWIGTGVMGAPMCGHLFASGYPVTVFNRTPERARGLLERGAAWAESPQAVAQHADVVFTMVGFPDDLREIVLGPAGTLAGAGHGTILVASGMVAVSEALLYATRPGSICPPSSSRSRAAPPARGRSRTTRRASSPGTSRRASAWTTSSRTWASRWRRRGGCASRCRASPWWSSSISRSSRRATAARARMPSCSRSRGSRPWSGRLHLQHLRRRVERADRRRHARVARGLHQHLDQLLARDAEVEGAREVQLQLLGPSERRELRHGAQAPAAQIEVRARPEHAEHELRHQAEELRRELLRRQLPAAGARAPELRRDLEAAREVVRLSRHRFSPL